MSTTWRGKKPDPSRALASGSPAISRRYTASHARLKAPSSMFSPSRPTASSVWMPAASMMATLSQNALTALLSSTVVAIISFAPCPTLRFGPCIRSARTVRVPVSVFLRVPHVPFPTRRRRQTSSRCASMFGVDAHLDAPPASVKIYQIPCMVNIIRGNVAGNDLRGNSKASQHGGSQAHVVEADALSLGQRGVGVGHVARWRRPSARPSRCHS